jgi:hypothetical protein
VQKENLMSDEATAEPVEQGGKSGWTPPASPEELNRIIADRVSREKAKYADYNDLKTKASRFDELAESQKSETQKAIERAEAAERDLASSRSEQSRLTVIAKHGIPEEYQELVFGNSPEEIEARAAKVKSLISTPTTDEGATVRELFVPGEGYSPATALNGDGIESALKKALGL